MSAHEAGRQLGYAAFPVVLLAIAFYAGWRMGKKRRPQKFVVWPVAVAAAMVVAGALGVQLKQARERAYSSEIR